MEVKESIITFLLGHFKQKPGMYLGRNQISLLSTFMTGYMISLTTNRFDLKIDPFYWKEGEGFFDWYSKKSGITQTENWYTTMLEQSDNSEEKGLDLFLHSLEEFCKNKKINVLSQRK
jgi:hypothetical protein